MSFFIELQRRAMVAMKGLPPGVLRTLAGAPVCSPEGYVLDPQMQILVRLSDVLGHGEWAPLGKDVARKRMDESSQILQAREPGELDVHDEVVRVRSVSMGPQAAPNPGALRAPDGVIQLRVYRPVGAAGPLPIVVFYHGGGFVLGSLRSHDGECRALSLRVNALVVAVDYRLSPEHKFPVPVDDAGAAYRWVVEHAASLGGDATRIAVCGDSAGGNIAAVVARDFRDHPNRPVFQVLVYPATDMTRSMPSHGYFEKGFFLTKNSIDWFLGAYLHGDSDQRHPRASPLLAGDHAGLAPALVLTAGFDSLRDEGKAYAEALSAAGVDARHICVEGQVHGFFSMSGVIPSARVAFDEIVATLRAALGSA